MSWHRRAKMIFAQLKSAKNLQILKVTIVFREAIVLDFISFSESKDNQFCLPLHPHLPWDYDSYILFSVEFPLSCPKALTVCCVVILYNLPYIMMPNIDERESVILTLDDIF